MRFSATISVLALAAASAGWAAPHFASHPTVAAIKAAIDRDGAPATVGALFEQGRWDEVSAHIARGEPAWVALADELSRGTDAGTAEDLVISLAFALPRDAPAVLAAVQAGAAPVGEVCGAPFIEGTLSDVPSYKRRAAAALERIADATLAATKAACLDALAEAP